MESAVKTQVSQSKLLHYVVLVALFAGVILSIVAWMHICSEACAAGHKYRLYGYPFEPIGVSFFAGTTLLWAFSWQRPFLRFAVGVLVSGAMGAELMFTYAQKYIIKSWCPVCLSIAAAVSIAFIALIFIYARSFKVSLEKNEHGGVMKGMFKAVAALGLMVLGFMFAEHGFAKFSRLQAVENEIKSNVAFGNQGSKVEVYVFTDWKCPSCHKIYPVIEKSAPKIMDKAKLIFVDIPIHEESVNFTPYNLSFMINNKDKYFKLRDQLQKISEDTDSPTDEEVSKLATKLGTRFKELNYADVSAGIKYFEHVTEQFKVEKTPTVVIVNSGSKKGKKLEGTQDITEKNIISAIDALK